MARQYLVKSMLALVVTGLMAQAHATAWPDFSDYPAQKTALKSSKPLRLLRQSHWLARRYPSAIRYQFQQSPEPNFAGHYQVARMGCGTGCLVVAITDLRTGKVQGLPGSSKKPYSSYVIYANPLSWVDVDFAPISQVDSRLLRLSGCIDGLPPAGYHSFVLRQGQLQRLSFTRPPLPKESPDPLLTSDTEAWNAYLDQACMD